MTNPTQRQVGGDHYTKLAIQPMQYSMANGLNALQHTIVKYVTRYKDKGGIEDLRKAAHCVELLIQHEMGEAHKRDGWKKEAIAAAQAVIAAAQEQYHGAVLHGHELYSEEDEKRMDVVGSNGNDGEHYWQINRGVTPTLTPGTRVMVEYRNGDRETDEVQVYDWSLEDSDYDIIRWRLA